MPCHPFHHHQHPHPLDEKNCARNKKQKQKHNISLFTQTSNTKVLHYHITDTIRHLFELYVLYRSPYKLLLNIAHSTTTVQRNAELHLSNCHSKIKDCKAEESCTLPTICLRRSLEGKIQFSI